MAEVRRVKSVRGGGDSELARRETNEALLRQYDRAWHDINHLDGTYTQITLLYMALLGAYIGVVDKDLGNPFIVSLCLAVIGLCIMGIIVRLRALMDRQISIATEIERITDMVQCQFNKRSLGRVRTSMYLQAIIVILTGLAIFLTLAK
jgi:hypothetical protein